MTDRWLAFALASLAILPGEAAAHAPIAGIGTFYNGVAHPILVPAHLMLLFAIGLMCGQHAPALSRFVLPAFCLALIAGLAASIGSPTLASPQDHLTLLLTSTTIAGALVALGLKLGLLAVPSAAFAGVLLGIDSAPDPGGRNEMLFSAAGVFLGATLSVLLIGGATAALARPWQKISVRALGSWVAAAALMVLALSAGGGGTS
ncbi:MAG: HupE/UreJ family protein [Pseudomonadota bacterium]